MAENDCQADICLVHYDNICQEPNAFPLGFVLGALPGSNVYPSAWEVC